MKTNSENHETWRHNMLSHVEAMIKISKNSESVITSGAQNPNIFVEGYSQDPRQRILQKK